MKNNKYAYLSFLFVLYPVVIGLLSPTTLLKFPRLILSGLSVSLYVSVILAFVFGLIAMFSNPQGKGRYQTLLAIVSTVMALTLAVCYVSVDFF